jgi:hypothetical protein
VLALDNLIIFVKKTLDQFQLIQELKQKGLFNLKEGNGKTLTFLKAESWTPAMGNDWIYLLFDLFQIRSICGQFSEVSLDVVEFASKPTIYHSPASKLLAKGPTEEDVLMFSLIREPNWNKFLFQINSLVLVKMDSKEPLTHFTDLLFPLFSPGTKELYLGPEGDIKILKG